MVFTYAKAADDPIISANNSFLSMSGFERDEASGHSFNSLLERGADPDALAQINAAFAGVSDGDPEIHYERKHGSTLRVSIFTSPVRDESGAVVPYFVSFIDITRHRAEQAQSRMLINELNHRVKNTLTTVQSIVSQASPRAVCRSYSRRGMWATMSGTAIVTDRCCESRSARTLWPTCSPAFSPRRRLADVLAGRRFRRPPDMDDRGLPRKP